jgi:hypothetical protein
MRYAAVRGTAMRYAAVRGTAMRHWPVGHAAIWVPAVRPARARRSARPSTVGHAVTRRAAVARDAIWRDSAWRDSAWRDSAWRNGARGEPAGLAWVRASRRAEPLLPGRHFARAAQQLTVVVFFGAYRPARPGGIILLGGGRVTVVGRIGFRTAAAAIPLAPGWTVRVTAEAGVATFHQIPPGP